MTIEILLQSLPQYAFIIFISTFAGALSGEFYKEVNNRTPCSFLKFLSRFIASWLMSFAAILFLRSTFGINKDEVIISMSMALGFFGHKYTIDLMKDLINSKLKSNK